MVLNSRPRRVMEAAKVSFRLAREQAKLLKLLPAQLGGDSWQRTLAKEALWKGSLHLWFRKQQHPLVGQRGCSSDSWRRTLFE